MFLSAVSALVVAQSIFEIPDGLMNNPVYKIQGMPLGLPHISEYFVFPLAI
jgi:hypothetical protein